MRSKITISWLLFLVISASQASTLKGTVKLNEPGGGAVAGVEVTASGANLWKTKGSGQFILEFTDKQPGELATLTITKPGYVVVNWFDLKVTLPKDPDAEPLTLLICKQSERDEWAALFYRVKSSDVIDDTYKKRVKELQESNQKTAEAMAKLRQERDQAKAVAAKTATEFARVTPGEATNLYAQAMSLFLKGKVDEALQVLDEGKLQQSLAEAQRRRHEAEEAEVQAVNGYLLKAQLLTTQFRFQEAEKVYLAVTEGAEDSFWVHMAYADFNYHLNRFSVARTEYTRALELARRSGKQEDIASALNNLANLELKQSDLDECRQNYEEALKIRRLLTQQNPQVYSAALAFTLRNLGILDEQQGRMDESRQHMEEAAKTFRQLAQQNAELHSVDLADMLANLGNLNDDQNRADEARQSYEEALKIYRRFMQLNMETYYVESVADTLNNLGLLNENQERWEEAQEQLAEALKDYRLLAQENPETYLPNVALTLNNLGNLNRYVKRSDLAGQDFEEALKTYRGLAQRNPETYLVDVAETLNNLGILDGEQKRMDESRQHYEEAVKSFRELAQQKQAAECKECFINTLNNLAILDQNQDRPDDARQHFEEALKIGRELAQTSPGVYLPSVAAIYNNLATLDISQNRADDAEQAFDDALKTYRQLAQQNPEAYEPHVAETLENLGRLDASQKHLEAAQQHYEEALNIYRPLAQKAPDNYRGSMLELLITLADLGVNEGKVQEALQYYDQVLQLEPTNEAALVSRGHIRFDQGKFVDAEKDFTGAVAKNPTDVYVGLWLYLSATHQGKDATATLKKISTKYDLTKWPGQVIQLYLGTLTKEVVLAAAEDRDPTKNNEQHCEAYFYLAEQELLKNDRSEAIDLFQKSIHTGVRDFVEYQGATVELTRLNAPTSR